MGILSSLFGGSKPVEKKQHSVPKVQGKVTGPVSGVVKNFNPKRKFGFVIIDGEKQVFVHSSVLPRGVTTLKEGQKVSLIYGMAPKGPMATELKLS